MKSRLRILDIFFFLIIASCSSQRSSPVIGLNENIHHDDFEYAVTNYSLSKIIEGTQDSIVANGNFYLIHFRVINNALRVDHAWNNSTAYIIDEAGNIFENDKNAQKELNSILPFGCKEKYLTRSQSADTTMLIYDLPLTINHPYLMIRGKTLMGDIFDRNRFRRTKVRLF